MGGFEVGLHYRGCTMSNITKEQFHLPEGTTHYVYATDAYWGGWVKKVQDNRGLYSRGDDEVSYLYYFKREGYGKFEVWEWINPEEDDELCLICIDDYIESQTNVADLQERG